MVIRCGNAEHKIFLCAYDSLPHKFRSPFVTAIQLAMYSVLSLLSSNQFINGVIVVFLKFVFLED